MPLGIFPLPLGMVFLPQGEFPLRQGIYPAPQFFLPLRRGIFPLAQKKRPARHQNVPLRRGTPFYPPFCQFLTCKIQFPTQIEEPIEPIKEFRFERAYGSSLSIPNKSGAESAGCGVMSAWRDAGGLCVGVIEIARWRWGQ